MSADKPFIPPPIHYRPTAAIGIIIVEWAQKRYKPGQPDLREKFAHIIRRAFRGGYNELKFQDIPEYANCGSPKLQLLRDLSFYRELHWLADEVKAGVYDDAAYQEKLKHKNDAKDGSGKN